MRKFGTGVIRRANKKERGGKITNAGNMGFLRMATRPQRGKRIKNFKLKIKNAEAEVCSMEGTLGIFTADGRAYKPHLEH